MPSHTNHSALVQLWYDGDRAPWNFRTWQEITNVHHGLFNANDALLPKGWTREMATSIESYFDQYSKKPREDDKIKFASARSGALTLPGRDWWRSWVTEAWKQWKIHSRISEVLTAENLHPLTFVLNSFRQDGAWPNGAQICPLAVDPVAKALFGVEALNSTGRLDMHLRSSTQALIQRSWINLHNQFNRSKKRIVKLEKEAIDAFNNLDRDKLTKAKIKSVIEKVARWKALAEVLQTNENVQKMEEMEDELKRLMVGLGAKLQVISTKKNGSGMTKVNSKMLSSLASEEDVADIINLYTEFFESPGRTDCTALQEQVPTIGIELPTSDDGTDPGVEVECSLPPEVLARNLGFTNGLPLLFNSYRHRGGLSAWDAANTHAFEPSKAANDPEMEPIALHSHQLCGVHSIVRMNFSPKPAPDSPCGTLVTDDVGLGKTFQSAATVAFLTDLHTRQTFPGAKSAMLPPIIRKENPYLGAHATVPDLPHLIIVPGTLLSQWETELKVVLKPKSFDILMYGTGKAAHEQFWAPNGPFHTSKHKPSHRIIVASHSALQQDFSSLYSWEKPPSSELPWVHPPRLANYLTSVGKTLFGQQYFVGTVDEAQVFRNLGPKHSSALLILEQSTLRIVMTATPLQTSTKDLAAMGRLLGLPHFLSEKALLEEKADMSSIRKARTDAMDAPDEEKAVRECQRLSALRIKLQFEGRILRRTRDSKNWLGKPLIVLPPYEETLVVVKTTARELEIITEHADKTKPSASASNSVIHIACRAFYIEHRKCVGFARYDLTEAVPVFSTLTEWEEKKSTKFDTCARMCRHILTRDDAPPMIFENGVVVYPDIPLPKPGENILRETKILIYQEFPSLGPLLRNVLELYGIRCMFIDGQTSLNKRAQIVDKFRNDPSLRVLIVSSVGSTGLNLTAASVVIFLDQPWSAQDELQIRGRAHRQPQKKVVKCYHILADDTADVVLAALARGKQDMLESFLQKDTGKDLVELLSGNVVGDPEDDLEEGELEYQELQRERKKKERAEKKASEKEAKAAEKEAKAAEKEAKAAEKKAKAAEKKAKAAEKRDRSTKSTAEKKAEKAKESDLPADVDRTGEGQAGCEECRAGGRRRADNGAERAQEQMEMRRPAMGKAPEEMPPPKDMHRRRYDRRGYCPSEEGDTTDPDVSMISEPSVDVQETTGHTVTLPSPIQPSVRRQRSMVPDSPEVIKEKKRRRQLPATSSTKGKKKYIFDSSSDDSDGMGGLDQFWLRHKIPNVQTRETEGDDHAVSPHSLEAASSVTEAPPVRLQPTPIVAPARPGTQASASHPPSRRRSDFFKPRQGTQAPAMRNVAASAASASPLLASPQIHDGPPHRPFAAQQATSAPSPYLDIRQARRASFPTHIEPRALPSSSAQGSSTSTPVVQMAPPPSSTRGEFSHWLPVSQY
ncbi:putative helicase [Lyophyllum shimeji]|uniref:Helicase n=1 Tax=Lyophyllum shimeji TaxID=47721 RepID=A0A9P3UHP5_LYOSH|nr:putative helicase [Lyophyllum shimeji]